MADNDVDWSAVADGAHREWVDSEREDEIASLRAEVDALRNENEFLRQMVRDANKNQDFDFAAAIGVK